MSSYDVDDVINGLKTWSKKKFSLVLSASSLEEAKTRYKATLAVIDGLENLNSPIPEEVIEERDILEKKIALSQKEKESLIKFSDELITLANEMREHFPLVRRKYAYKKGTRVMYQSPFSCVDRKTLPSGLADILEVCLEVYTNGKEYNGAAKVVAERSGILVGTVYSECTRVINLNTKEFKDLLNDKKDLITYLKRRFPKNEQQIEECLAR